MSIELTTHAKEQSTYKITAAFTDAESVAVTPNTVTWTLSDKAGTVINSRSDVSATPDTSIDIILSGDDLAFQTDETYVAERIITIKATYDSTEGSGLPLYEEASFYIDGLVNIP